jgi:hypothetical protein
LQSLLMMSHGSTRVMRGGAAMLVETINAA